MSRELPHPIVVKEGLPTDTRTIKDTRSPDEAWHFRLSLRWPADVGPRDEDPVPQLDRPKRLLHFRRQNPMHDIIVTGHYIDREIDPHHFLEDILDEQGRTIVSANPIQMVQGIVGDVVATWEIDGVAYAGRFFANKWGPRMFVVSVQSRFDDYKLVADDFFETIASFDVLNDSYGILAELVHPIELEIPVPWKAFVPDSWRVQLSPPEKVVAGFVAANLRGGQLNEVDGMLSMGVALRKVAKKPRKAARMFLDAVHYNRIELEHEDFIDEAPKKPFKRIWCCTTDCTMDDLPGEMRCRVMMSKHHWVVAGLLGPRREDDPVSWRENKRALDIATSTLEL